MYKMKRVCFFLMLASGLTFSLARAQDAVKSDVTAEKLAEGNGLKNPWGMTWLPDGRLLITERSGEILIFKDNKFTGEKLVGVPKVVAKGQGGLMDIQLHPIIKRMAGSTSLFQNRWVTWLLRL
jgi:glucose/arabinose dehydrogenase